MKAQLVIQEKVREVTNRWVYSRPLSFEQFLDVVGPTDYVDLVDGMIVEKKMVQLEHEKLQLWLVGVLNPYVKRKKLGILLGSRSAIKISEFRGRLPDLFFVSEDRIAIVQEKATYGAPDLIIEIVSPNDRPSDLICLEADYATIGVREIVFIDIKRRRVRTLRLKDGKYSEDVPISEPLVLETLGGLRLEQDWLFREPRPDEHELVSSLFMG
jgi:Uma2 family endonuclease